MVNDAHLVLNARHLRSTARLGRRRKVGRVMVSCSASVDRRRGEGGAGDGRGGRGRLTLEVADDRGRDREGDLVVDLQTFTDDD